MFIKVTLVNIDHEADNPHDIVKPIQVVTMNSDCIESCHGINVYYTSTDYVPYTEIGLKGGRVVNVAEPIEEIDFMLETRGGYKK